MVEIFTASERDISIIEDILIDAVHWLDSIGRSLWREDEVKWERLSKNFGVSDFRIAFLDGKPAACMAIVDHDPVLWPDARKGSSLFIHKLAVRRGAAGRGVSGALIDYAKEQCRERGVSALRLDCSQERTGLRALYEGHGFSCVEEKVVFGKYYNAFYECRINDTRCLYHYFERTRPPFLTLTSLTYEEAEAVIRAGLSEKTMFDVDNFLRLRYERDKIVRDRFISIGGKPIRTAPVYFTLGANEGMKTWYDDPAWIRIPVGEFDPDTVSFTYGDTFAVLNPGLDTGEEWWGRVCSYDEILRLTEKYGWPEDPPYDMKNRIFPKDKHINHCLKYIEAHVWSDEILDRYRKP